MSEVMKVGVFQVEPGSDPMCAGDFLKVLMPDGRVLMVYADAVDPEGQGGKSVVEVWESEEAYDQGRYLHTKQWAF